MTCSESCRADVRVFSLACFSALADTPAPRPRFDPAPSGASVCSCDQLLVGDALAGGRGYHRIEPSEGLALDVALVQSEGKLVEVAPRMLAAGVVINANDAAFHDRENAFDAVRCDVAAHVFARRVVDRIVAEEQPADAIVDSRIVRVEHRTDFDIRMDGLAHGVHAGVGDGSREGSPAALTHTEHSGLTHCAAPGINPKAHGFFGDPA